jgi:secretion/DNA translocation related TadE-like protein
VTRERGAASVLAVAIVVLGVALTMGAARLGGALVGRARAETAADAAALAAADALARGHGADAAASDARVTAARNDARLVSCACTGTHAEVVVEVDVPGILGGVARGRARAEVTPECIVRMPECR